MVLKISNASSLLMIFLLLLGCSTSEKKNGAIESSEKGIISLAPQDFKSKLSNASNYMLIDVRKPEELATDGFIRGAVDIDYKADDFTEKANALDKDKTYFIYCKSGKRSAAAASQMEQAGFKNIYTLEGGYMNWAQQGLEIEKP